MCNWSIKKTHFEPQLQSFKFPLLKFLFNVDRPMQMFNPTAPMRTFKTLWVYDNCKVCVLAFVLVFG